MPTRRPIKVLRLFVSVFFQVFYIAALGVFLVAIDCHFLSDDDPNAQYKKHRVQAFQEVGEQQGSRQIGLHGRQVMSG